MGFQSGEIVFFRHPKNSWILGKVTAVTEGKVKGSREYTCTADDAERQCVGEACPKLKEDEVTSCREDLIDEEPNDLLSLTVLHDSTLLRCLYLRYMKDIIYTNIGAIVVALNPFNFKIPWYLDSKMPEYLKEGNVIEKNLPHSWAQAHNTYFEMMQDGMAQTILVSGESGAGKTEASKIVMKYLAAISNLTGSEEEKAAGIAVGTKLNACSPLLEAFGNARTVRNDNSSRFGKFMKIKFSKEGKLRGAFTIKYLLEKSRIVTAANNERVYHSFYVLLRGSYKDKMQCMAESNYKSINAGKCLQNSEFNTAEDFQEVLDSMGKIGMSTEQIESTWATVAGVLASQNINFEAEGEGSKVAASDKKYLADLGRLWKVDAALLEKEFTTTLLVIGKDKSTKLLRPVMAVDARDALSKSLYDGLFGWLVERCNELCDDPAADGSWIGLLDIFGFEDFEFNSFEQLCINLTNETLQNHYNAYIFEKDMAECRAEGIDVADIVCPDNKPCLRLITANGGIMALLDDQCSVGNGTDIAFLETCERLHGGGKNPFFDKKMTSRDTFIIKHYAASVTYNVTNWLEKNRDTIKDDIRIIMRNSTDPNIANFLAAPTPADQVKTGKKITVGGFFKDQLNQLMDVINSTNPHWIRCIKPHPAKKPKMFDGVQTLNQLESSGVLGTVKIRKAGYPIRTLFDKFNMRYRILLPGGKSSKPGDERETSREILKACQMDGPKHAQIGKTKVFMKSEAFPLIERKRNDLLAVAGVTLQRVGKAYMQRKQTNADWCKNALRQSAKTIVQEYRSYLARSRAIREERARLRREAELKFRGLRTALEEEMEKEKQAIFSEFAKKTFEFVDERNQALEAEKARVEYFRGARETFARQETMSRIRLFEEFTAYLTYLSELYFKEIATFSEIQLHIALDEEVYFRRTIENEEADNRNKMWRVYVENQSQGKLEAFVFEGLNKNRLYFAEETERNEIYGRLSIEKSQIQMRRHFNRQLHSMSADAQRFAAAREEFEGAQRREVRNYELMRQKELERLQTEANERQALRGGGLFHNNNSSEIRDLTASESFLFQKSRAAVATNGIVPPLLKCAPDDLNPFSRSAYGKGGDPIAAAGQPSSSFLSPTSAYSSPPQLRGGFGDLNKPTASPFSAPSATNAAVSRQQQQQYSHVVTASPSPSSSAVGVATPRGAGISSSFSMPLQQSANRFNGYDSFGRLNTTGGGSVGNVYGGATASSPAPFHPRSGAGIPTAPTTVTPFNFLHSVGHAAAPLSAAAAATPRRQQEQQQQQHHADPTTIASHNHSNANTNASMGMGDTMNRQQRVPPHSNASLLATAENASALFGSATGTLTYPEAVRQSLMLSSNNNNTTATVNRSSNNASAAVNAYQHGSSLSSAQKGPRSALDPSVTADLTAYVAASAASLAQRRDERHHAALYGALNGGSLGRTPLAAAGVGVGAASGSGSPFGGTARAANTSTMPGSSFAVQPTASRQAYGGGGSSVGGYGLYDVSSPSPKPAQQQHIQHRRVQSPAGGRGW